MVKLVTILLFSLALLSPNLAEGTDKKKSLAGAAAIVGVGAGIGTIASKFIPGTAGTVVGVASAAAGMAGAGATIRKKFFPPKKPEPILPVTNPNAGITPAPSTQRPAPAVIKGSNPPPKRRQTI